MTDRQKQPDSQRQPFGPKQQAWIALKYGCANFRKSTDGPSFVRQKADQ